MGAEPVHRLAEGRRPEGIGVSTKLDAEALRRIAASRKDQVDQLREARTLAAQGASFADIGNALDVPTAIVRALIGPQKGPRTPRKRLKSPRNRVESVVLEAVADEIDADHDDDREQQDHS